jgi:cell shape-determining protein MreD
MKPSVIFLMLILLTLLQALLPVLGVFPAGRLPLLTAWVLSLALQVPRRLALGSAALAGALQAALDLAPWGASIAAFMAAAAVINLFRLEVDPHSVAAQVLLGAAGGLIWVLVFGTLCVLSGARMAPDIQWVFRLIVGLAAGAGGVPLMTHFVLAPLQKQKVRAV